MDPAEALSDVGEFALLDRLLPMFPQSPDVAIGPGDDAAVLDVAGGRVVACTDVLVEGTHFKSAWSSGSDVGRKAAAVNMADIAAMGARPTGLLVGLAAPPDLDTAWVISFADGLRAEAEPLGCSIVGGDTVAGPVICVTATALGVLDGPVVRRDGARVGDVVAVCGRLGWAAAGLSVLQRGFRSPRALVDAQRRPEPPYAAGPQAASLGATAMIDVSDGLLADLGHIAAASDVGIVVEPGLVPQASELVQMARGLGLDARAWVFGGGEDHALAACFPPDTELPDHWTVIGQVESAVGVQVTGWDELPDGMGTSTGHQHFSR